jgi:hypothetical protein
MLKDLIPYYPKTKRALLGFAYKLWFRIQFLPRTVAIKREKSRPAERVPKGFVKLIAPCTREPTISTASFSTDYES